jgi:hypothetical protein
VCSVRTSQETHYVSATKPNRLMLFIVRNIRNTQVHSVGRMQSFTVLSSHFAGKTLRLRCVEHTVWTTQSKGEDHGLVKPRQTSISLVQNIIRCHIRKSKRLPTVNSELHPKSEPVTTQQKFAPEIVQHIHLCIIFYYILIFSIFINFNILQFTILTYNTDIL